VSLTDIMSSMKLSTYPQIAMCLFLLAFVAVAWRAYSRKRAPEMWAASMLPLEDDEGHAGR